MLGALPPFPNNYAQRGVSEYEELNSAPKFEVFTAVKNTWFSRFFRRVVWWLDVNVPEHHAAYIFRVNNQLPHYIKQQQRKA